MGFGDAPCSSNSRVFLIASPRFQAFPLVCFTMEIPGPPLVCALQKGSWNPALICPSVMLFSLSLWQALRHAREGGWRDKVSREKPDDDGGEPDGRVSEDETEICWVHQEGRGIPVSFSSILFFFVFFLVWVCFWRWGDKHLALNSAPNAVTAKEIVSCS